MGGGGEGVCFLCVCLKFGVFNTKCKIQLGNQEHDDAGADV